jgi:hypothetical protein
LLDESVTQAKVKKMFDQGERTNIKEIPPAKDRISDYKRKCFGKLFQDKVINDKPISAAASSTGLGDATT